MHQTCPIKYSATANTTIRDFNRSNLQLSLRENIRCQGKDLNPLPSNLLSFLLSSTQFWSSCRQPRKASRNWRHCLCVWGGLYSGRWLMVGISIQLECSNGTVTSKHDLTCALLWYGSKMINSKVSGCDSSFTASIS